MRFELRDRTLGQDLALGIFKSRPSDTFVCEQFDRLALKASYPSARWPDYIQARRSGSLNASPLASLVRANKEPPDPAGEEEALRFFSRSFLRAPATFKRLLFALA